MRERTLAFDIGTSSIGWAWVEKDQIVDTGVHIFPEGVENLGKGEGMEMSTLALMGTVSVS